MAHSALSTSPATSASCTPCWPAPAASMRRCWWWRSTMASCRRRASTRRSSQLLGIARGVVALTKADLARGARGRRSPRRCVRCSPTPGSAATPLLPVSAMTGEGIEALRAALLALGPRPRDSDGYPRLAVDRAFTLAGAGLVVTGTLVAGRIARGRSADAVAARSRTARARTACAEPAGRSGGGRTARCAEHHRSAAVEGFRDTRRLGAASRRACTDRSGSTHGCACWRRRRGRCASMRRCICIWVRRM